MNRLDFIKSLVVAPAAIAAAAGVKEGEVGLMVPEEGEKKVLLLSLAAIPDYLTFEEFWKTYKETGCLVVRDGYDPESVKVVEL